jgi:hypothetical protein
VGSDGNGVFGLIGFKIQVFKISGFVLSFCRGGSEVLYSALQVG